MKTSKQHHIFAIITIVVWALSYPITRMSLQYFNPLTLSGARYLLASLVLLFFTGKMRFPARKDWGWFLLSGSLGFSIYMVLFNTGSATVSAATTSVIIALTPVVAALLARFFYKETLQLHQWLALAVCFFGVVVLTAMEGGFGGGTGLYWLFGAVLCVSVYNILQRKLTRTYTALEATTYSIFVGTIGLSLWIPEGVSALVIAPVNQWVNILILSVGCSAIGYVFWSKALAITPKTSTVTNYMFLLPFLAALGGYFIAGEVVTTGTFVGGCIILLGLAIFNFGGHFHHKS